MEAPYTPLPQAAAASPVATGEWFAEGSIPRVSVRVAPAARWVVERFPVDEVTAPDADGWVVARLPVANERWLAQVLLTAGPDVELVDPGEFAGVGPAAARRALARYE